MSESVKMAIELLGQGMAGIFTVLIVIALIVALVLFLRRARKQVRVR